jgi:hypothetical protein
VVVGGEDRGCDGHDRLFGATPGFDAVELYALSRASQFALCLSASMESPFFNACITERAGDRQKILMSELIARKLERPTNQNPESTLKPILIGFVWLLRFI